MDTPHPPRFLAFITYAPQAQLDAIWLKDAVEAAAERLGLPQVVGLESEDALVRLENPDASAEQLDGAIFLIVVWSKSAADRPEITAHIERFLTRAAQTRAREYLIPLIVPADSDDGLQHAPESLQERLHGLSAHWIPTLTRRPDDGTWTAWSRVTEQIAALMARALLSVVGRPHADDRHLTIPPRASDHAEALASARSMMQGIERQQAGLQTARHKVAEASTDFVRQGTALTARKLDQRRFVPEDLQAAIIVATEAYHDQMEAIVEDAALRLYETERRSRTLVHDVDAADAVSSLEPVLCDLHDQIAPERPLSVLLREILDDASPAGRRAAPAGSTVGTAVGFLLGPVGALVGGIMGAARDHHRKKASLTSATRQSLDILVEQAQHSVERALHSIDDELLGLNLEWQARLALLEATPPETHESPDVVECDVFAPPCAVPGRSLFVQVVFHTANERTPDPAALFAVPDDIDSPDRVTLALAVRRQQRIAAHLSVSECVVAHPLQVTDWQGDTEDMGFSVRIPEELIAESVTATVRFMVDGVPMGHTTFTLRVAADARPEANRLSGESAGHYTYAYIAYAHTDQDIAERWARAFRAVGLPYCIGRMSAQGDDERPQAMLRAIDRCDLFLLCWSAEAANSDWVSKEWSRALERGGDGRGPAIVPVYAVDAPATTPPAPLAGIPFITGDIFTDER